MNTTEIETINRDGFNIKPRFGFIPRRLESDTKLELSNFPLNILFVSYKTNGLQTISGTAFYEPDLNSFYSDEEKQILAYKNIFKSENLILISYFINTGKYHGQKFINDKLALMADGIDWQSFFVHLTMIGLSPQEGCKFEEVNRGK